MIRRQLTSPEGGEEDRFQECHPVPRLAPWEEGNSHKHLTQKVEIIKNKVIKNIKKKITHLPYQEKTLQPTDNFLAFCLFCEDTYSLKSRAYASTSNAIRGRKQLTSPKHCQRVCVQQRRHVCTNSSLLRDGLEALLRIVSDQWGLAESIKSNFLSKKSSITPDSWQARVGEERRRVIWAGLCIIGPTENFCNQLERLRFISLLTSAQLPPHTYSIGCY
eukprot:bmy_07184T0